MDKSCQANHETHRMKVDFFRHALTSSDATAISQVLDTPFLTSGNLGKSVEVQLASFFGTEEALLVNSWTNGCVATLLALDIGPGDEVIVPAMTFIATANCAEIIGATPVFCDVSPQTLLLEATAIAELVSPKTRAVIPVHLYGRMCDIPELRATLDAMGRPDISIIEDAAHCFEGMRDNARPGCHSDAAIFSFYATKNVTCGEGGAIVTNNRNLAERLRATRLHGMSASAIDRFKTGQYRHWDMERLGIKANLPDILAALLPSQIREIQQKLPVREAIAQRYITAFAGSGLRIPGGVSTCLDARHLFCLHVPPEQRDTALNKLSAAGVGCTVNYRAVPGTRYYSRRYPSAADACPVSRRWGAGTLSIPFFPGMNDNEIDFVIDAVLEHVAPLCAKRHDPPLGTPL